MSFVKKNIVTGGCSFSETMHCIDYRRFDMMDEYDDYQPESGYKSWALHLEDIIPNSKVHNTAMPGAGNGWISRAVIYKVNELLELNLKVDYVCIQLSGCDREEILIDVNDAIEDDEKTNSNLLCHFIPSLDGGVGPDAGINWNKINLQNNNMMWMKSSYDSKSMLRHYHKYYNNNDFAVVKTLEHILRLQWFFKVNDIKYKIFSGWNIFDGPSTRKMPRYPIEIRHLWTMIDWDNFWFHRKLGGIGEWSRDNLPFNERFITGDRLQEDGKSALDEHPSNIVHKKFAKEVVSKWINNI